MVSFSFSITSSMVLCIDLVSDDSLRLLLALLLLLLLILLAWLILLLLSMRLR